MVTPQFYTATIPAGRDHVYVDAYWVGEDDVVMTSIATDLGQGNTPVVEAIDKNPGYGFTIWLSGATAKDTDINWRTETNEI